MYKLHLYSASLVNILILSLHKKSVSDYEYHLIYSYINTKLQNYIYDVITQEVPQLDHSVD